MAADELIVHGAREHNLKDITVRLPRNRLICITGLSGSGKSSPCLRHDLRGRAAPLRRVALRVRAPVPADDGEAGRRPHRRPQPGDLDRPEDDLAQPALDGRHRDRDLRLPAPPVRAGRAAALPDLRQADRGAEPRRDRRPGAEARGGDALHGQRARRPRPQGRVQGRLRGPDAGGLHARQGRRRAVRPRGGRARARQEVQAHDRGRRRPARDARRPAAAAHAVDRDGGRRSPTVSWQSTLSTPASSSSSPRTSRAPTTASRCRSCSRGSSPSTRRTAPARAAPASARSRRSTRTCSCPIRRSRSTTARSCRGRSAARRASTRP